MGVTLLQANSYWNYKWRTSVSNLRMEGESWSLVLLPHMSSEHEWMGEYFRVLCVFTTQFHWLDLLAFSCNRVKQMRISPHCSSTVSVLSRCSCWVKSPVECYWDLEGLVDLCCRFHSLVSLTYLWMYRRGRTSLAKERDMKIQLFVIYIKSKIFIGNHIHGMGRLIHINQGIQIYIPQCCGGFFFGIISICDLLLWMVS